MLFVRDLFLQETFIFQIYVLRKVIFHIHPILDAVETLFRAQVEEIVDCDPEDFRQQRQGRDVRHCRRILPLGYRLGGNAQLFCQLILCQSGLVAQLSDLFSEFHI